MNLLPRASTKLSKFSLAIEWEGSILPKWGLYHGSLLLVLGLEVFFLESCKLVMLNALILIPVPPWVFPLGCWYSRCYSRLFWGNFCRWSGFQIWALRRFAVVLRRVLVQICAELDCWRSTEIFALVLFAFCAYEFVHEECESWQQVVSLLSLLLY